MTVGSPLKHILLFMLPTLVGYLFQQLYNMFDTVIIGRFLGEDSLAAVGSTGSVNFMIIGFCVGLCSGFAIPVAQEFGAGEYDKMRRFVVNSVWSSVLVGVPVTVIVYIFSMNILRLMETPANIINEANTYISIIFLGIPATMLYNLAAGIMRSLGDSRTPVYFLLFSSALNIVLDLLMVKPLGIAGPAIATVMSQLISGILCVLYMRKKFDILKMSKENLALDAKCIGRLLYIGIPMGLQYSVTAIGSVILQKAVNVLGSSYVASSAAAIKMSILFSCPFDALGSTAATYSGQNMGAGKIDRITKGMLWSIAIGWAYALVALLITLLIGPHIAGFFLEEPSTLLIENTALYLNITAAFYFLLVIVNVVRFTIQGMGYSILAILAGIFEMIARGVVGAFFVPVYGYIAACFASPMAWVLADIFLITAYVVIMIRLKKQKGRQNPKTGQ